MCRTRRLCLLALSLLAVVCRTSVPSDIVRAPPYERRHASPPSDSAHRAWTFLFVASLDNDLGAWAEDLRAQLVAGASTDGVAVSALIDDQGLEGLHRLSVTAQSMEDKSLPTEDGTSLNVLEDFLAWTSTNLPADRYVLTFINHGGALDEMGRDDHPGPGQGTAPAWMAASQVGRVVRRWRESLEDAAVELLVFEQCGRASIENLYSFAGTAELLLASDSVILCPGTYYGGLLGSAAGSDDATGVSLAETILDEQGSNGSYVLVRGDGLAELPARFDRATVALDRAEVGPVSSASMLTPCYCHGGECQYDLLDGLWFLSRSGGGGQDSALREFSRWIRDDLVVLHHVSGRADELDDLLRCGISICLPSEPGGNGRYADLPFYRDSLWGALSPSLVLP